MTKKFMLSEEVIIDLQDYVKSPKGFVLFYAGNGRGKSYAAMKIYEQSTPYKLPAYDADLAWFINQAKLNILFSETIEKFGSSISLIKQTFECKLLIIDDLGTRKPTDPFMDFLYAIIDHRWNERNKLGTIITTNLDSAAIREKFGDPILSRIASGRIYEFLGEDRRLTNLAS